MKDLLQSALSFISEQSKDKKKGLPVAMSCYEGDIIRAIVSYASLLRVSNQDHLLYLFPDEGIDKEYIELISTCKKVCIFQKSDVLLNLSNLGFSKLTLEVLARNHSLNKMIAYMLLDSKLFCFDPDVFFFSEPVEMMYSKCQLVAWYERNANDHNTTKFLGFEKFNANMGCIIADYTLWMKNCKFVVATVNRLVEWNQFQKSTYPEYLRWHWIDQGLTPSIFKLLGASIYIIEDSKYIHPKCSNYVDFNNMQSYIDAGFVAVHHFGAKTLSRSFFKTSDDRKQFLSSLLTI